MYEDKHFDASVTSVVCETAVYPVAWLLPDGSFQGPISSTNVWPYPVDLSNPAYPYQSTAPKLLTDYNGVTVDALPLTTTVSDGGAADLTVTGIRPTTIPTFTSM